MSATTQTAQGTKEVRARLTRAQAAGEDVVIRYQGGRTGHWMTICLGRVEGFVKRPREREKVQVVRRNMTRCEVRLADIESVTPLIGPVTSALVGKQDMAAFFARGAALLDTPDPETGCPLGSMGADGVTGEEVPA